MFRWMCTVRPKDRISEECRIRLNLKHIRECLQNRRVQQFGVLEKMEENA